MPNGGDNSIIYTHFLAEKCKNYGACTVVSTVLNRYLLQSIPQVVVGKQKTVIITVFCLFKKESDLSYLLFKISISFEVFLDLFATMDDGGMVSST